MKTPNGFELRRSRQPGYASSRDGKCRGGFTLMELLLVISIIVVLSTTALGILRSAQEEARKSATLALMNQIHTVLKERIELYEVRKVPVRLTNYVADPIVIRQIHQMIIADIMDAEMPRTAADQAKLYPSANFETGLDRLVSQGFLTNANKTSLMNNLGVVGRQPALKSRFNAGQQDAEYFYGVLATSDMNDAPGTDMLGKTGTANDDGDGFFELVDAWGDPLLFEIQQLEATETADLVWEDTGIFEPLNPEIPRPMDKIRIVISSSNIPD